MHSYVLFEIYLSITMVSLSRFPRNFHLTKLICLNPGFLFFLLQIFVNYALFGVVENLLSAANSNQYQS